MEELSKPCLAEAIAVARSYENGRIRALRGVDLRIAEGDFVAITGSSGSGKTTLLQMLGGLDTPDSGEVMFRGQTLSKMRDLSSFRARKVGFVFQSFHLLSTLTACENVQVPMVESPLPTREREKRAIQLLEEVGLAERIHHRPAELSGGERQRVAIARSLANEPDLLLADEPTGNLDTASGEEVLQLLLELHRQGNTILLVTHDERLARIGDTLIRLRDGEIETLEST